MRVFHLKADCTFLAESIDDALLRLARHFLERAMAGTEDPKPVQIEGSVELGPSAILKEHWNWAEHADPTCTCEGCRPPQGKP
jgi:hypothetical protein